MRVRRVAAGRDSGGAWRRRLTASRRDITSHVKSGAASTVDGYRTNPALQRRRLDGIASRAFVRDVNAGTGDTGDYRSSCVTVGAHRGGPKGIQDTATSDSVLHCVKRGAHREYPVDAWQRCFSARGITGFPFCINEFRRMLWRAKYSVSMLSLREGAFYNAAVCRGPDAVGSRPSDMKDPKCPTGDGDARSLFFRRRIGDEGMDAQAQLRDIAAPVCPVLPVVGRRVAGCCLDCGVARWVVGLAVHRPGLARGGRCVRHSCPACHRLRGHSVVAHEPCGRATFSTEVDAVRVQSPLGTHRRRDTAAHAHRIALGRPLDHRRRLSCAASPRNVCARAAPLSCPTGLREMETISGDRQGGFGW